MSILSVQMVSRGGWPMWLGPQAAGIPASWVLTGSGETLLVPYCFDVGFYTVHVTRQSLSPTVALHNKPPQVSAQQYLIKLPHYTLAT